MWPAWADRWRETAWAGLVYSWTEENSETQMRTDGFMKHNCLSPDAIWLPWTERWSVQYAELTLVLVCAHQPWRGSPRPSATECSQSPAAAPGGPIPSDNDHILLKTSWVWVVTGYKWVCCCSCLLLSLRFPFNWEPPRLREIFTAFNEKENTGNTVVF